MKESGYHRQGGAENTFYRYKTIFGDRMRSGRAGIVLGLEVSRLARNNTDWHHLLEIRER